MTLTMAATKPRARKPFDPVPLYARLMLIDRIEQATHHGHLDWLDSDRWGELFAVLFPIDFSEAKSKELHSTPFWQLTREERIDLYCERATRKEIITRRYEAELTQPADFSALKAADCCHRILRDNGNTPTSVMALAREAISRGYQPIQKESEDETLFTAAKSFWARLSGDARFKKVREGVFVLRRG